VSIAGENDSDLRYSEVPLKGKIKHLSKYWGGGSDPCNPCGVDTYAVALCITLTVSRGRCLRWWYMGGGSPVPASFVPKLPRSLCRDSRYNSRIQSTTDNSGNGPRGQGAPRAGVCVVFINGSKTPTPTAKGVVNRQASLKNDTISIHQAARRSTSLGDANFP